MKHLKLFEDIFDDEDFDYEEENPYDELKVGDYVTITDLYNKYPNWSKIHRYRYAVKNGTPLKISSIGTPSDSDKNKGFDKTIHFTDENSINSEDWVFYVPDNVCVKIIKESFEFNDDDFDFEEEPLKYKYIVDVNKPDKDYVYVLFDYDKIFKNHQMPKWAAKFRRSRELTPDEIEKLKNDEITIKIKENKVSWDDDGWNYYDYSELIKKYPELKI